MKETTIEPVVKTVGDKEYNNFYFKPKRTKNKQTKKMELVHEGIPKEHYIIIKKTNNDAFPAEGRLIKSPYGDNFSFMIEHAGNIGTVLLDAKKAEQFRQVGDVGDLVKVWVTKESFVNEKTGLEVIYDKVNYEVVG